MGPVSPTAGSLTIRTRVASGVHVMPTHDVQMLVELSHWSFEPCGTAAAKACRACLSDFKLAHTRGRRETMTNTYKNSLVEESFMGIFSQMKLLVIHVK